MKLYEFVYSDCIYENSFTISIHYTKEGAEKAMAEHKDKKIEEIKTYAETKLEVKEFLAIRDWYIKEIEVQP